MWYVVQVASCERTCLPTGEAATKVKSILRDQNSAESAMQVVRLGSRTGSRPVRKSFGKCCFVHAYDAVVLSMNVLWVT